MFCKAIPELEKQYEVYSALLLLDENSNKRWELCFSSFEFYDTSIDLANITALKSLQISLVCCPIRYILMMAS